MRLKLGSTFQTFLFATISFQFPGKCFSALSGVAQVFADFLHPLEICLAATEIKFCPRNFQLSGKSLGQLSPSESLLWQLDSLVRRSDHSLAKATVQLYIFCKRSPPHICRSRFCVGNVPSNTYLQKMFCTFLPAVYSLHQFFLIWRLH